MSPHGWPSTLARRPIRWPSSSPRGGMRRGNTGTAPSLTPSWTRTAIGWPPGWNTWGSAPGRGWYCWSSRASISSPWCSPSSRRGPWWCWSIPAWAAKTWCGAWPTPSPKVLSPCRRCTPSARSCAIDFPARGSTSPPDVAGGGGASRWSSCGRAVPRRGAPSPAVARTRRRSFLRPAARAFPKGCSTATPISITRSSRSRPSTASSRGRSMWPPFPCSACSTVGWAPRRSCPTWTPRGRPEPIRKNFWRWPATGRRPSRSLPPPCGITSDATVAGTRSGCRRFDGCFPPARRCRDRCWPACEPPCRKMQKFTPPTGPRKPCRWPRSKPRRCCSGRSPRPTRGRASASAAGSRGFAGG